MIRELFFELYRGWRNIVGDGNVAVLYIASVIALLTVVRAEGKRAMLLCLSVLGTIGSAISYAIGKVRELPLKKRPTGYAAVIFSACLCLIGIASSGRSVFSPEMCERAENGMHISSHLITAMDAIMQEEDDPVVLAPFEWTPYFKAYSSHFTMASEDNAISGSEYRMLSSELDGIHPDMKKVASVARQRGYRYVVLPDDIWPEIPITGCGYELLKECGKVSVYREVVP